MHIFQLLTCSSQIANQSARAIETKYIIMLEDKLKVVIKITIEMSKNIMKSLP